MIGPHAAHGERDDRRIASRLHELPDHAVQSAVHIEECPTRRLRRWMPMQRVAAVDAVPKPLDAAVRLARDDDEQIPLGKSLGRQPSRRARARLDSTAEDLTHRACLSRRRPWCLVRPFRRIAAESPDELRQDSLWAAGGRRPRIVRAPADDALRGRSPPEVDVGRVVHDDTAIESSPPGDESRPFLPRAIRRGIELDGSPALGCLRR